MYHLTSHLRLNAVYWGLVALCIMGHKDGLDREEMIEFVMSCWDDDAGPSLLTVGHDIRLIDCSAGAFGAHPDHDAHIHSTLSAIQILVIHDALDRMDTERVVKCMPLP
jgi:geranylgeranyl transferase type-2 subunit beta